MWIFHATVKMPEKLPFEFTSLDRLTITACGTASYAGLVAKYWFERIARLPTEVDIASEFRYREAPLTPNGLSIVISQSGETADTLASLRYSKSQGQHTLALVNVPESTIAREASVSLRTYAGPEIGVASTKAFTCQLAALACLALLAAKQRGHLSKALEQELVGALVEAPRHMSEILKQEKHIAGVAREIAHAKDVLYLGRGINYPIAMEGALKLKEISYIHAEGYAAAVEAMDPCALSTKHAGDRDRPPMIPLRQDHFKQMRSIRARGKMCCLRIRKPRHRRHRIRVPKAHSFISRCFTQFRALLRIIAVFSSDDVYHRVNLAIR